MTVCPRRRNGKNGRGWYRVEVPPWITARLNVHSKKLSGALMLFHTISRIVKVLQTGVAIPAPE
jgi:hypothetical protein